MGFGAFLLRPRDPTIKAVERMETPGGKFDVGKWEPWFAWRPVHLYGTVRFAWLRRISKRYILCGRLPLKAEYTDSPAEFPPSYGLREG